MHIMHKNLNTFELLHDYVLINFHYAQIIIELLQSYFMNINDKQ